MSDYPEDLKYSTEHEWVRSGNGNSVRVGITEYAAEQLGDIVFVRLRCQRWATPWLQETRAGNWSPPRACRTSSVLCQA